MAETDVFGIVIPCGLNVDMLWPFAVAELKPTVPKLVSGKMPPLAVQQGASAMTSAEDSAAPGRVALTVWVQPLVVSLRTSWNLPLPW
ncbi:MAG TPA: hypothetical protein VJ370_00825 [Streptosporangiaceae bacterium]|nr:hypothetical protein [Streptosporangiaceae bacterium]